MNASRLTWESPQTRDAPRSPGQQPRDDQQRAHPVTLRSIQGGATSLHSRREDSMARIGIDLSSRVSPRAWRTSWGVSEVLVVMEPAGLEPETADYETTAGDEPALFSYAH